MNNIYQTNFRKNSSIYLKQKRLRHLNVLIAKNLKIKSNRFFVWFTLHYLKEKSDDQKNSNNQKAFFIRDKKENERNPKWTNLAINLNKFTNKEFILR